MSYLNHWGEDVAATYDDRSPPPAPGMIDRLAELAGTRPALEFAIGTGRVAIPLRERGVDVHGLELSEAMTAQLRAKPGGSAVTVTIGDMAATRAEGEFELVYLVFNTISNLTSQDAQTACFANAAAHLGAGGYFVIENGVPNLRELSAVQTTVVFTTTPTYIGFDEYTDFAEQKFFSHHWYLQDGKGSVWSTPFRYVWPSEMDLMARLAGMERVARWRDWECAPFTGDSTSHVSVWQKT